MQLDSQNLNRDTGILPGVGEEVFSMWRLLAGKPTRDNQDGCVTSFNDLAAQFSRNAL
jgi:hypothetical protein